MGQGGWAERASRGLSQFGGGEKQRDKASIVSAVGPEAAWSAAQRPDVSRGDVALERRGRVSRKSIKIYRDERGFATRAVGSRWCSTEGLGRWAVELAVWMVEEDEGENREAQRPSLWGLTGSLS